MWKHTDGEFGIKGNMANKIDDNTEKYIVADYLRGMRPCELEQKYSHKACTIINVLRRNNVYVNKNVRWTSNEIEILKNYYSIESLDVIAKRLHPHSKKAIIQKASNLNIKSYVAWNDHDISILQQYYGKLSQNEIMELLDSKREWSAIKCKAQKLDLNAIKKWSDAEINIIKTYYSNIPMKEILTMLPDRTEKAIQTEASALGIKSLYYISEKYDKNQLTFIAKNHNELTDAEIANALNKTIAGISEQRRSLGIYKIKKDYSGYENIAKFFRGHLSGWRKDSMTLTDGKCYLTGDTDVDIHHIYNFNNIVCETFDVAKSCNIFNSTNIDDYSIDQLNELLDIFLQIHSRYPLGICLRKDIHKLFHMIYGKCGNTEEQFWNFICDFDKGKYRKMIA